MSNNKRLKKPVVSLEEKEWEETLILLTQLVGRVFKVQLIVLEKQDSANKTKNNNNSFENNNEEFYNETTDFLYAQIVETYTNTMKMVTPEVATAVVKSIYEIYSINPKVFYYYYNKVWTVFEDMGKFISTEFFLTQLCTLSSGSKMIYYVIEILREIFIKNKSIYNVFDDGKNLMNLLYFTSMLLKSARSAEGVLSLPNKQNHLTDEKNVFDFLEQLISNITTKQAFEVYHRYLLGYVKYDLCDIHSEAHCRRALEILEVFYYNKKQDNNISFLYDIVTELITEASYICCLRNKNEYVTVLINNNKKPMLLWHFTVFQLIKILKIVLCSSNKKSSKLSNKKITDVNTLTQEFKLNNDTGEDNKKLINNIWDSTIQCFENLFKQSEGGYKNIRRNLIDELFKSCQEMEVLIINFIVNDLLPHSLKIDKNKQIKLLNLLDLGCNCNYSISNFNTTSASSSNAISSASSSISKVCISNLFNLCKFRSQESIRKELKEREFTSENDNTDCNNNANNSVINNELEDFVHIKIKIAKMSTPILLRRCKEILKSYYDEEIKSGSMPLSRNVIEDVKFVIESLKNIEVYPNYHIFDDNSKDSYEPSMYNLIMQNKKSHLFALLPYFSEFITSKEEDIKLLIKDIFKIISKQVEKK